LKTKLDCILLVDDNHADNCYHKIVINDMNITKRIEVALDGEEALKLLDQKKENPPELIFLDINMPKVNGWEFLEAYQSLPDKRKAKTVIIMLSTSDNPKDLERTKQIKEVGGYKIKPLTVEMMEGILKQHFLI
jgi:CheY-like chemotaxis protein